MLLNLDPTTRQIVAAATARAIGHPYDPFCDCAVCLAPVKPQEFTPYRGLVSRMLMENFCRFVHASESQVRDGKWDRTLWGWLDNQGLDPGSETDWTEG